MISSMMCCAAVSRTEAASRSAGFSRRSSAMRDSGKPAAVKQAQPLRGSERKVAIERLRIVGSEKLAQEVEEEDIGIAKTLLAKHGKTFRIDEDETQEEEL